MKDFFAGRNSRLLTEEEEIRGIRIWHMELEEKEVGHMSCRLDEAAAFLYVVRGSLVCQVNHEQEALKAREGLFINSGNAYRFLESERGGCELYLALIEESYVSVDEEIAKKYVTPIWTMKALSKWKFEEDSEVVECLDALGETVKEKEDGYELDVRSLVFEMWRGFYQETKEAQPLAKKAQLREKEKLQEMLKFLHENYREKITLTELASHSEVSTGEYCRFFKKRMGQTPFEYLQAYRIEKSLPQLLEKVDSISCISLQHGFTGSSYYAETFKKEMGCAPGDYRKWCRGEMEECPLKDKKEGPKPAEKVVKTVKKQEEKPEERRAPVRRDSMPAHLL